MNRGSGGGGRGRGGGSAGGRDGGGAKKAAASAGPTWKKPAGANLSAKAKKEYLKWKREQKRNQGDSDSDWGACGGQDGEEQQQQVQGAGRGGAAQRTAWRRESRHEGQSPALFSDGSDDDQDEHLDTGGGQGDPTPGPAPGLGRRGDRSGQPAVPGPRNLPTPRREAAAQPASRAAPDDRPLEYVPLVQLPKGDVPEIVRAATGAEEMRLPRVREDEVGFTEKGRGLGMPKRPQWRGVVRNADQLHQLEERSFQAWVDRMYGSVDSSSRVSFFEPKLDFWRQLWRVLERSDVAIMIVDARNPLLHFSEALARHVLDEHGIPALLVLNKCDLVPRAAAEQWRGFFEARCPGLKVVATSASAAGSTEAAAAIVDAVLDCDITRDGRRVKVCDVVQMRRDELLAASKGRNTHSKRDRPPRQPSQQPGSRAGETASSGSEGEEGGDSCREGDERTDDDDNWALKGNKARKKQAVSKKRNQRMHGGGGGGGGKGRGAGGGGAAIAPAAANAAAPAATAARRGGGRWAQRSLLSDNDVAVAVTRTRAEDNDDGRNGEEDEDEDEEGDEPGEEVEETGAEQDSENDNAAFDDLAEGEDEEDFRAAARPEGSEEGEGAAGGGGGDASGAAAVAGGWGGHGARGGRDRRGRSRPVVACVVGEPNVGKSSTMNALLGAKRVAVSSHPGRTKHYQTHVMCPRLMLCDCPGLVFPRLDVSLDMQVLFGSYPIARCRDPYTVVRYLAERVWPRLHVTLGLRPVGENEDGRPAGGGGKGPGERRGGSDEGGAGVWTDAHWTPLALCEALAARHNWRSRRGGRLDVYRAANWLLRSALAGRNGVDVAFLPPA